MSLLFKGGRLPSARKDVVSFTSSIKSDKKLWKSVIKINETHVIMMMEQKIIDWPAGVKLLQALNELKTGINPRHLVEDIHMSVEEEIINKAGAEIGGNLHIAKSRNDQVSTAIRMELRENLVDLTKLVIRLQEKLIELAKKHMETVIPGYTHLQPAQPVTFAHYLLSYVDILERSLNRLEENYQRVNLCPMGAGALATSSFPINRARVADLLGFNGILENSMDAVSSRDFILETQANLTIMAIDISRLTEDLIVWSSPDFGIIELPDSFSSTSSIMPQKKNPDALEVIRARMSHMLGNFVTSATTMKSLPSSYNLDFQEVTPILWESLESITSSLDMLSKLVTHLKVSKDIFNKPFLNFSTSTELVNMLVRKHKVPFRTAHKIVGALTRHLIEKGLTLSDVTPELLQTMAKDSSVILPRIKMKDIHASIDPLKFVKVHKVRGGPAPIAVKKMIKIRKKWMVLSKARLSKRKLGLDKAEEKLQSAVKTYDVLNKPPVKLKSSSRKVG
jgi:argininosuccinate lyase